MIYRQLGRTGWNVSAIGFGAWAIGGSDWGGADDDASVRALHAAIDAGVNFIDTADVYGDGRSERLVGQAVRERSEDIVVATKAGRRLDPHTADGYADRDRMTAFVERSLRNLGTDAIDLLQLHCPPTEAYHRAEIFGILDDLVDQGKVRHYGVSVEKVEEAMKALDYPGVQSVQIIFNMFRLKPAEEFFAAARDAGVGILARVPLASGLLTGKFSRDTDFDPGDHRAFNREGEAFDRGETFSGVDYERGLDAVDALREIAPDGPTMAQWALRWILSFPEVTTAIPGARNEKQAVDNAAAAELPAPSESDRAAVRDVYDRFFRETVHPRW
jgi:aryl-alcohol dehydrogenase-like predicted oxidoreductase